MKLGYHYYIIARDIMYEKLYDFRIIQWYTGSSSIYTDHQYCSLWNFAGNWKPG